MVIKVCLHSETLTPGGVNHHIKNIAKYIDKTRFDLYLATTEKGSYHSEICSYFDPSNVFIYKHNPSICQWDFGIASYPTCPPSHELYDFLETNNIQIFHDQRGGEYQFPLSASQIKCRKVETNIFGGNDPKTHIDKILCISKGVLNHRGGSADQLYLAIDFPETQEDLREELDIASDTIVLGKSSNGWDGDSIFIEACKALEKDHNIVLLLPSMSALQRELIQQLNPQKVREIPAISSYRRMSAYYNTLDISVHDGGESFGCAVAEAMMHCKPVVSCNWSEYISNHTTGHQELIEDKRYFASGENHEDRVISYINLIRNLVDKGREFCALEGRKFQQRILGKCDARTIVSKLEVIYESLS